MQFVAEKNTTLFARAVGVFDSRVLGSNIGFRCVQHHISRGDDGPSSSLPRQSDGSARAAEATVVAGWPVSACGRPSPLAHLMAFHKREAQRRRAHLYDDFSPI